MKEQRHHELNNLVSRFTSWFQTYSASPILTERNYALLANNFVRNFSSYIVASHNGIIAINKPAGLLSHVGSPQRAFGISELAKIAMQDLDVGVAHRLDMDTSGIILLGNDSNARASLNRQFESREVKKRYIAVVEGYYPEELSGVIAPIGSTNIRARPQQVDIDGKTAATSMRPILRLIDPGTRKNYTVVEVGLHHSGRTHQIRVHSSYMEYPIVGDTQYHNDPSGASRQLLHAYEIDVREPGTQQSEGRRMVFRSPIPDDFRNFISRMEIIQSTPRFNEVMTLV